MKRSLILKNIADFLMNEYGPTYQDGVELSLARAVTILDMLEDSRMRPPYDASQDDGVDTMEWEAE